MRFDTHLFNNILFISLKALSRLAFYHRTDVRICGETRSITHTYSYVCDEKCDYCGYIRTVTHTYSNACDSSCNLCQATRVVPPHNYEATINGNVKTYICTECEHTYTETVDTECEHSFTAWESAVAPTCTVAGKNQRKCTLCNTYEYKKTEALGHLYGEWYKYYEDENGYIYERKDCARCGSYTSQNRRPENNTPGDNGGDKTKDD